MNLRFISPYILGISVGWTIIEYKNLSLIITNSFIILSKKDLYF